MEMFWRTKGKRIAAWLMIALIMATTIPFGSISASADNTATGKSGTVTITGQVMVPYDTNENTGTSKGKAYAGAKVIVKYPKDSATTVTHNAITGADGSFTIPIDDLTLKEDDKYTIEVEPADADKDTYDRYSDVKTVTADQVSTKAIELSEITLKKKSASYSVTANANTSDNSAKNDAGEVKVENNVVTATPKEGYEITAVTVKKETADWKPDGETNDNWWNKNINASGAFVYEEFKDKTLDANYAFTVTFAKKQFTITYKISQNGKLILNSDAQNDKVEITTESGEDGSRNVPYTDSEYKIKAAVTDNKYHLTSFRVDNDEKLNENEINNSLKEKEYIFSEGIKQAHSIEVTAEIDTYTVSVTTDDGGIVEVNGSSEKNIIVDSGAEVAIIVKPNEGKTVKIFSVNGTPIQENNLTEDEDGTAVYKIENVNGDQNVTAEFEDIQNENKDSLALAGLNLLDSGNNQITADEDGNYYSSSAILKFDGKTKISLSQWGVGKTQLNLTETTIISSVYKGGIIGRKQISLNPSVKIVIDTTKPKIELSDDEKTIWKTEADTTVDITGTAVDENLKKVVWSETELTPDDVLNGAQEAALNENGKFEISGIQLAKNQNIDKIYIYAIDKAKQCSEAGVITVYRDSAAPEIKEVSLIPADTIKKYDFGNYYNTNIRVSVTAKDVNVKDGKADYPAVGVKEIRVYSDDDTKVYTGTVSTQVSGTSDAMIEVTIPLEEAGTFASLKKVHIKAVDALGNESEAYKLTAIKNHNDILSDDLMLEKDAPIIKVTPQADGKYENAKDGKTEYWYKEIPTIACEVTDQKDQTNGSGLAARTVTVNGVELTSKTKNFVESITGSDQIVQEDSLTLSASDLQDVQEGENTVVTTYTDIAGNKTIDTKTICLDTHKPDVTRFNIEKKDASKILNILTFGNYGNGVIKVTVTADDLHSDDGSEVPSAGLNEITLYVGEEAYQTKAVGSDNTAVFELPAETVLNEQKVYLDKKISAIVTDNVGNQSEKTLVTTANSNVKNSNLMIETVKPTITSVLSAEGYVGKNGIIYNNSDTGVSIKVEDKDSGIYNVKASVNNKELVNVSYPDQKTVTESYEINTKDAVINADTNSYDMVITAIDNAGNEYSKTQRVYKDITAPEILSVDMEAAGNKEADGSVSYTETDYGYYFVENTKVTVTATDGSKEGDSGVKEIHYYTVDANGTKSSEQIVQADAEGKVTFVVQAGFKGQIYACAYDMLNNHEERYVTPSSLIIETAEQHAREKHIDFNKAAAASKDAKGNELYEKDVMVDVTVTDTFSGIRSVEWTVESPYDKENNQSGNVEISNQGAFSSGNADGWSQTKKDKNLVTELKKSFTVKNNSNEIKMHIKMTDRAGNTSEDELIFSIDKTKPEIKIAFDNETPDAENTTMFKENRVATITVTERNFEAADFKADITNTDGVIPELSAWQTTENTENPDQSVSTATITFAEDGDYTLSVSGKDKAANQAETVKADDFTIDKTRPVITVTYDNNNCSQWQLLCSSAYSNDSD